MPLSISENLLIKLAGKPSYQRGKDYFDNGAVLELGKKGNVITASVEGTHVYRVRLEITDKILGGDCDCPASENFDFCKHCVATALAFAQQLDEINNLAQGNPKQQTQAYLLTLNETTLRQHLQEMIDNDSLLQRKWLLKSQAAFGTVDIGTLKKAITKSLPYRQLWGYRQVDAYFNQAETQLEEILEQVNTLEPEKAIKLLDYAYLRLNKALERIDDSNGARFYLESLLQQSLIEQFHKLPWNDKKKAGYLLDKLKLSYDVYPEIPGDFIAESDTSLQQTLLTAAQVQWDSWQVLNENDTRKEYEYWPLKRLLLDQAEKENDLAQQIAIKTKVAIQHYHYVDLCELNIQTGDIDQAYAWLDKAKQTDRFRHNQTCQRLELQLLIQDKKYQQALDLQWNIFTQSQTHKDYLQLRQLYKKLKKPQADCYKRTESYLLSQFDQSQQRYGKIPSFALIEFYLGEGQLDKAVTIAQQKKADPSQLIGLADKIAVKQPNVCLDFYQRVILKTVAVADRRAYEHAISLLKRLQKQICKLDNNWEKEFQRLLGLIRIKEKRKPSLMKLLDEHFGSV